MRSVYEDTELLDWLRWAEKDGTIFLRQIADAAFVSDLKDYCLLRPVLVKLKERFPTILRVVPPNARVDRADQRTDLP